MNSTILPPAMDKWIRLTLYGNWFHLRKSLNSNLLNSASKIDFVSHPAHTKGVFENIYKGESKSNAFFFSTGIITNTGTCIIHENETDPQWFTSLLLNIVTISLNSSVPLLTESMYPCLIKFCWLFFRVSFLPRGETINSECIHWDPWRGSESGELNPTCQLIMFFFCITILNHTSRQRRQLPHSTG